MKEVGTSENARFIRDYVDANREWENGPPSERIRNNPPKGWTYLGKGSFRSTWRGPDGAAYKVQHQHTGWGQDNQNEYDRLIRAWGEGEPPRGVRLPACSYFPDSKVIALECINGETVEGRFGYSNTPDHVREAVYEAEDFYGIGDMHDENVMYEEETGLVVPIDFGC